MAYTGRNQKYLGIDSNVLVAYLVPDHPDHALTKSLARRKHAVNPTVLHETYHTCVFKLRRKPEETVQTLLEYMDFSLCIPTNSTTVDLGLRLALKHRLGGRDALILASYASSDMVSRFITFDRSLLDVKWIRAGQKSLRIARPVSKK